MFSLIITIIAIALVAALALASIFYGGSALTQGTATAEAARLVNDASQVTMANSLSAAQGNGAQTTVAALVTANYLASAPASLDDALNAGDVTADVASADVCDAVNAQADRTAAGGTADKAAAIAQIQGENVQFGCEASTDSSFTFVFKG